MLAFIAKNLSEQIIFLWSLSTDIQYLSSQLQGHFLQFRDNFQFKASVELKATNFSCIFVMLIFDKKYDV